MADIILQRIDLITRMLSKIDDDQIKHRQEINNLTISINEIKKEIIKINEVLRYY